MHLKINQTNSEHDYLVELNGEIDIYTADKLSGAVLPLTENEINNVEIDLGKVSYLDSTGLGVFIAAYKSATENRSSLKLINAKERVLRLFQITGLDKIIDVNTEEGVGEIND